jgi:hypothetical protein
MTGGEIVAAGAAGKVAAKAAAKALRDDDATIEALRDAAKDLEAFRGAAESYAKRIAIKQAILLRLWAPFRRFIGADSDYFISQQFAGDLAEKTAHIPVEHLAAPHPTVAIPALEALSYSHDEPNLKEMYLNLLAAAGDDRRSDDAHPSFAEIIKQLSPGEAGQLREFLSLEHLPVARLKLMTALPGQSFQVMRHHVLNWHTPEGEVLDDDLLDVFVDNWIRLGLAAISYMEFVTDIPDVADPYHWVTERPEFIRLRDQGAAMEPPRPATFDRGILRRTEFGVRFARAVMELDSL